MRAGLDLHLGGDVTELDRGDDAGEALRADVYGVSSSAVPDLASSTENAARSRPSTSRRPASSRWVAIRPASAQRRAVSGLTPSSRAAWPIV
ncbi:hypothetical protein STAFG_1186 [Streptomyces afghaniensis 772]|uniref:Uncharacterized protein n=1 Tax=Streptomyces afghaniensis 772 TaxID=1283301 RepID=S4N2Z1_9ACTN|nr:hypothetical protein STAFG_1186 [Streptomyces afghaniensis 772]